MEWELQAKCFDWFVREYPAHRKLLCYNHNNSSNQLEGFRNKKIGLQRGRSDLVLYFDSKAIMIEIKTRRGIQSAAQEDWQLAVEIQGFEYFIVRSLREFQTIINNTINGIHTAEADTRLHDKKAA